MENNVYIKNSVFVKVTQTILCLTVNTAMKYHAAILLIVAFAMSLQTAEGGPIAYAACVAACTGVGGTVVAIAGAGPLGYVVAGASCIPVYCQPLLWAFTP